MDVKKTGSFRVNEKFLKVVSQAKGKKISDDQFESVKNLFFNLRNDKKATLDARGYKKLVTNISEMPNELYSSFIDKKTAQKLAYLTHKHGDQNEISKLLKIPQIENNISVTARDFLLDRLKGENYLNFISKAPLELREKFILSQLTRKKILTGEIAQENVLGKISETISLHAAKVSNEVKSVLQNREGLKKLDDQFGEKFLALSNLLKGQKADKFLGDLVKVKESLFDKYDTLSHSILNKGESTIDQLSSIAKDIGKLVDTGLEQVRNTAGNVVNDFVSSVKDALSVFKQTVSRGIKLANKIFDSLAKLEEQVASIVKDLGEGINNIFNTLLDTFKSIGNFSIEKIKDFFGWIIAVGAKIIRFIRSTAISNSWDSPPIDGRTIPEQVKQDLKYAKLSNVVYGRKGIPEGYRPLDANELKKLGIDPSSLSDPSTGFYAQVYYNEKNNEYVVAYRGSDDLADWKTNFTQGSGVALDKQYEQAMNLARKLDRSLKEKDPDAKLVFVGHSLGGGLAASASIVTGRKAVTFDAAGVHLEHILLYADKYNIKEEELYISKDQTYNNITAYYLSGDLLSNLQDSTIMVDAPGKRVILPPPSNYQDIDIIPDESPLNFIDDLINGLRQHKIKYLIDSMSEISGA